MSDLLVVMAPRQIPECVAAFKELPIDKLWLRNMSEWDIQQEWDDVLEYAEDYDNIIISSDDGIPRKHALAEVQRLLQEGAPVATGYSNFALNDLRVNIATKVRWYDLHEVQCWPSPSAQVYDLGFALTGMSVEMWTKFPFQTYWNTPPGSASDKSLAERLRAADIPMTAARDALVWHVKEIWDQPDKDTRKRLLVGIEPASIELEKAHAT